MSGRSRFTVADLDLMPDDLNRYEVIDGDLFTSDPFDLPHQLVVQHFGKQIGIYLDDNPIGAVAPAPGVIFDEHNGVIPDLVFISNERRAQVLGGEKITGAPDIVLEVLSPGPDNERRDREVKRRLYAKFGVREYWIADLENRRVEIYRLKDNVLERVRTLGENDEITTELLPGFRCSVQSIFKD
jgi:Uma2 family endonuclease